jgi:hypothetical protein
LISFPDPAKTSLSIFTDFRYVDDMTKTELKKMLKKADQEQLTDIILTLLDAAPKEKKEVVQLTISGICKGTSIPPKEAEVHDLKQVEKKLDKLQEKTAGLYYRNKRISKWKKEAAELWRKISLCPPQSEKYEDALRLAVLYYGFVNAVEERGLLRQVRSWFYTTESPFQLLKTSQEELFVQVLEMILAQGAKKSVIDRIIKLLLQNDPEKGASYALAELASQSIKNGDFRMEIMEVLESRLDDSPILLFFYLSLGKSEMDEQMLRKEAALHYTKPDFDRWFAFFQKVQ